MYGPYRTSPLALGLAGKRLPTTVGADDFRRLAEYCGSDPETTVDTVGATVDRLRRAWDDELRGESERQFPALATQRLESLAVCRGL